MFSYDDEESGLCWLNPASFDLDEFDLVGVVVGLAVFNSITLDVPLPLVGRSLPSFSFFPLTSCSTLMILFTLRQSTRNSFPNPSPSPTSLQFNLLSHEVFKVS